MSAIRTWFGQEKWKLLFTTFVMVLLMIWVDVPPPDTLLAYFLIFYLFLVVVLSELNHFVRSRQIDEINVRAISMQQEVSSANVDLKSVGKEDNASLYSEAKSIYKLTCSVRRAYVWEQCFVWGIPALFSVVYGVLAVDDSLDRPLLRFFGIDFDMMILMTPMFPAFMIGIILAARSILAWRRLEVRGQLEFWGHHTN